MPRRDRVHQLGHRPALVAPGLRPAILDRDRVFLEHHHIGRQDAGGDVEGIAAEVVEAVGDDADPDAAAVDAEPGPGEVGLEGEARLIDEARVGDRLDGRVGKPQARDCRQAVEGGEGQPGRDLIGMGDDPRTAERLDRVGQRGRLTGSGDRRHDDALPVIPDEQLPAGRVGRRGIGLPRRLQALIVGRDDRQQIPEPRLHGRIDRHKRAGGVEDEPGMGCQQPPRLEPLGRQPRRPPGLSPPATPSNHRPTSQPPHPNRRLVSFLESFRGRIPRGRDRQPPALDIEYEESGSGKKEVFRVGSPRADPDSVCPR